MKKKPSYQDIDEFMNIFRKECDRELHIGDISPFQIEAVEIYGTFLATADKENFQDIAEILSIQLRIYNSANNEQIFTYPKELTRKQIISLKRAIKFRDTLKPMKQIEVEWLKNLGGEMGERAKRYKLLLELLDDYIDDLQNPEDSISWKVASFTALSPPYPKSKTMLKASLNYILEKYGLNGYTKEAKKLIDKINDPYA